MGSVIFAPEFCPTSFTRIGEAHSHTGTLRLVALVGLVSYGRLERMGECTLVDKRHLPFSGQVGIFDKSQIYIRFNPIYLVFCIVYHLFWTF